MTIAMRHVVKFPANVQATKGVDVGRANGTYTFKLNYENLAPSANVASNVNVAFQDPATGAMGVTTLASALNSNANIQAIANTDTALDKLGYWNGTSTYALTDFPAYARGFVGSASASDARSTLGLVIGTDVQAHSTNLDGFASKSVPSGDVVGSSDAQALTNKTIDGGNNALTNIPLSAIPTLHGGTTNQVLLKNSGSDGDVKWGDAGAGDMIEADYFVSVKTYGAKGDGATDDTTSINAALAANDRVYFPAGRYMISGTLTMNRTSHFIEGEGQTVTTIDSSAFSSPVITVGSTPTYWGIKNMTVLHSGTATSGGDGIRAINLTNNAWIEGVISQQNWEGLYLGPCVYGVIDKVICQLNQNYAIHMQNNTSIGGMQWQMSTVIAAQSGKSGIFVDSTPASSPSGAATLGQWAGVATFANNDYGIVFSGSANCPIANIRINGMFSGQNGKGEIYLDSYSTADTHFFANMLLELAGTYTTGPTNSTPATNIGDGIFITANNGSVVVANSWIHAMSYSGIHSYCKNLTVAGCVIMNNGGAAVTSNRFGIIIQSGGSLLAYGNQIYNSAGSAQQYGIYLNSGSVRNLVYGNRLVNSAGTGNSTANLVDASGASGSVVRDNEGYNPVGTSGITVGPSPFIYTSGSSPETIYIVGGTISGFNVGSVGVAANTASVHLGPNENMTVAYSSAPIMNKSVH